MAKKSEKKSLDFSPKQEREILSAIALLANAGVVTWRKVSSAEQERSDILVGAQLDLRVFGVGDDNHELIGLELAVYSDDGSDCAPISIPLDQAEVYLPETISKTETLAASPRVLRNIRMAEIAAELYPDIMKKVVKNGQQKAMKA